MAKHSSRGGHGGSAASHGGSSWRNPGAYHYSVSAGLGLALMAVQLLQDVSPLYPRAAPLDLSSLQPPLTASAGAGDSLTSEDVNFQIYVGGIQYHVISGDLKTASKLLNAARRAFGNSADLAALTCHVENERGRRKACLKACTASLELEFKVPDASWQAAALSRVSTVLEATNELSGAINAARAALKIPDAMKDSTHVFRLIQLLGKRAACSDLDEAQQVLADAAETLEPTHLLILQQTLPWIKEMQDTFCSFSHLTPEVLDLLHHPQHAVYASRLAPAGTHQLPPPPSATTDTETDTAISGSSTTTASQPSDLASDEPNTCTSGSASPFENTCTSNSDSSSNALDINFTDFDTHSPTSSSLPNLYGHGQDPALAFLFAAQSPTLRAVTQFLGGEGASAVAKATAAAAGAVSPAAAMFAD